MMRNLMLTIMLFLALAMAVAAVSEDDGQFRLLQDSSGSLSEETPEETADDPSPAATTTPAPASSATGLAYASTGLSSQPRRCTH